MYKNIMKIKFYNYFVIATIFIIVGCEVKELDDNEMVYISDTQFNFHQNTNELYISSKVEPEFEGKGLYRWVLDPIDGTRAFIAGAPTWGVLISVEKKGYGPIFGLIDQPYIQERFFGGIGLSEVLNQSGRNTLKTSNVEKIEDAILLSTFPEIGSKKEYNSFKKLANRAKLTRYGLDCYGYALVAMGTADLVIEAGLKSYDIQAPACVIEAAGGVVTTWDDKPAFDGGRIVAASNKRLHTQALDYLNS